MIASPAINKPIEDYCLVALLEDECDLIDYLDKGYYLYGFPVNYGGGLYQPVIKYREPS